MTSERHNVNRISPEAETAFVEFLGRREQGEDVDFEEFCAARPQLAAGLRTLFIHHGEKNAHRVERKSRQFGSTISLEALERIENVCLEFEEAILGKTTLLSTCLMGIIRLARYH